MKWRLLLELGGGYGIDDSGGGLAGTVFVSPVAANLAAVGMLVVTPQHAGRGLGRRLMCHALEVAADSTVFLYATAAGLPLYTRLGFRTVTEVVSHTGPYRGSSAAAQSSDVRRARASDLSGIAELDTRAFGADRSHVLRRMFDFAEKVVIAPGNGYAAGWRNLGNFQVGPLVAEDPSVATILLEALLRDIDGRVRIDLHSAAPALVQDWVVDRGLREQPPAPLMVFRQAALPGERSVVLTPFMQALG